MIDIKYLEEEDFLYNSRTDINNNFRSLADNVSLLNEIIDPANKTIQGIESMTINKGSSTSISDILFQTNGSGSFGGNLVVKQNGSFSSLVVQNSLLLESGALTVRNVDVLNDIRGSLKVDKAFILGSAKNDPVPMEFNNTTKLNSVVGFPTRTIGKVTVKDRSVVRLDFRGRNVSNTSNWLNHVRLDTADILPGHVLEVTVLLPTNPIALDTYKIVNGRLSANATLSINNIDVDHAVEFTKSFQYARFIYEDTGWTLVGLFGGSQIQTQNN